MLHASPTPTLPTRPLALWVGPEPTVNRVGDRWFDQMDASGFAHRLDDIDRLASLGGERIRFPLLWERIAPEAPDRFDWVWSDTRLARLRELGLAPIAGLLHHGSGPHYTNLLDPAFPEKLAAYARAVAERYPWIDAWTPVNEPLTTARFAGLYRLWYPHCGDSASAMRMLVHQIAGTVLAMKAIRAVNPAAMLVQTEDLGHVRSTVRLAYQAKFENARRWLSFDLLAGRVEPSHPFWNTLRRIGIRESVLRAFLDAPCPPDVYGINAYVTSERFLDHRVERYPPQVHGGNGKHRYADVEAVRVCGDVHLAFTRRMRETHERYQAPIALTEVHLGCSREEQLRWLHAAWRAAVEARDEGIDVRAITAWSAFGAFDWNSLLTRRDGHYESGLWDVRPGVPRATALVTACRQIARGEPPAHPVLAGAGWWQRRDRLLYPSFGRARGRGPGVGGPPLLITGAGGTLGRAFARICERRGLAHRLLGRAELDITSSASIEAALIRWRPWAVVNTAGYVRVDAAEQDPRQWRENAQGPELLAVHSQRRGIKLVTYSSDLVFDGIKDVPYVESDAANPLNAYGRAKHAGENGVLAASGLALVIRTAAFFGPWDPHNYVAHALSRLREGLPWDAARDQRVSPTYVPHLVDASLDLLIDGEHGLWHVVNRGAASWAELACEAARRSGLDESLVRPVPTAALGLAAPRPRFTVLESERSVAMPTLDEALDEYVRATLPVSAAMPS